MSDAKSRTCDLPQPTLTVTTNSNGKPRLTWNKVSGAVQYKVYGSTDGGATWNLLSTVSSTAVNHGSAAKGVTYSYKILAVASVSSANSAYSNVVSVTVR